MIVLRFYHFIKFVVYALNKTLYDITDDDLFFLWIHYSAQLLDPSKGKTIDWETLAQTFELTGGLIRNAVLSSIALASRNTPGEDQQIRLTYDDLYNGAKLQLR